MARITLFVVQTFIDSEDGLVAEEPVECQSAWEATVHAQALAMVKEGIGGAGPQPSSVYGSKSE
jgi:hypothetical protein